MTQKSDEERVDAAFAALADEPPIRDILKDIQEQLKNIQIAISTLEMQIHQIKTPYTYQPYVSTTGVTWTNDNR